jgi:hypothetical protein
MHITQRPKQRGQKIRGRVLSTVAMWILQRNKRAYNIPYAPRALIASLYCLAGLLVSDNSAGKPFLSSFSSSAHSTHFRYLTSPACPPTKSVGEFSNNFPAAVLICQFIDACGRTTVLVS